jgi:hypothetical protein
MIRRLWLFVRIVWRGHDGYLPSRIDWRTAWKVALDVHPNRKEGEPAMKDWLSCRSF